MRNDDLTAFGRWVIRQPKPIRWMAYAVVFPVIFVLEGFTRTLSFLAELWDDGVFAVRELEQRASRRVG